MNKLGFLNPKDDKSKVILPKVVAMLKDKSILSRSNLHPIVIYIKLRDYELGGPSMRHVKKEAAKMKSARKHYTPPPAPNANIIKLLHNMVGNSMNIGQSTGSRFMITLDTRASMFAPNNVCLQCGNVNVGMAAVIFALTILKQEKEVTIAVFTEKGIRPISIPKDSTIEQAIEKFKAGNSGQVFTSKPIEWCTLKKKRVDVFINIFDEYLHYAALATDPNPERDPSIALIKYRKDFNLPNTKLVSMSLAHFKSCWWESENKTDTINITGLDESVPQIMKLFIKQHFK